MIIFKVILKFIIGVFMSRYLKFSFVISFLLFLFLGCSDKPFSKDDLPSYSKAFNINANPNKDLSEALAQAKKDGRKVLIEAGGDWCKWCGTFDNFMDENQDITKKLHENFVFVKIYYGKGKKSTYIPLNDLKLWNRPETTRQKDGVSAISYVCRFICYFNSFY